MKDGEGLGLVLVALVLLFLLSRRQTGETGSTITNAETWEWTDWQGNTRQVKVHREVHQQ